jgi:uncharacterized protein YndB with AHSA1/START domain
VPDKVTVETQGETKAKFQIRIRGAVEEVWREITRTDAPIAAFFNSQMHVGTLAPGAKLAMRTADGRYTGVVGEILEYDPPRRFAHTFRFTAYDDPPCKVIYDLEDDAGGTRFTLTIEDLPAGTKTAKQMMQGGTMICNTMKSVIETGRPSLGIRLLYLMFKLMEPFTPKQSRSENWPVN